MKLNHATLKMNLAGNLYFECESRYFEGEVDIDDLNLDGSYLAIITVVTDKKESIYPFPIYIEGNR